MKAALIFAGAIGAAVLMVGGIIRAFAPEFKDDRFTPQNKVERVATYFLIVGSALLFIVILVGAHAS